MVGVINPPCNEIGSNTESAYDSPGSFLAYQSLAMAVTSVGPLPSIIMGGQLVPSSYRSVGPPGSPGPPYTGYSASCTAGSNPSSNSSEVITSSTTSTATSTALSVLQSVSSSSSGVVNSLKSTTSSSNTTSTATSTTSSGLQQISSSGGNSVYGDMTLRYRGLQDFIWQTGSRFGLIITLLFTFTRF